MWPLFVANFTVSQCVVAGLVGGWAALAVCSGRVDSCQLCSVVGRGVRGMLWDPVLCACWHQQGCTTGRMIITALVDG